MASDNSCHYDCSPRSGHGPVRPYPDITGVGVLVGYIATAGIVVLILVFHYHLAHDPTKDPFRKDNDSGATASRNPRPNPIDVTYLGLPSKARTWLRPVLNLPKARAYPRLEAVFVKCVQSMSDLQLITGTSILISGYAQLRCGIRAFHWQTIVLLAWFSSVTHLSCLTFLRNHLYNRPAERECRLAAMGLMLLMLLVATIPTGNYDWREVSYGGHPDSRPYPSDYAICYLRPKFYWNSLQDYGGTVAMAGSTMVISVVSLTWGFLYRVIRLHKSLTVFVVGRARETCSEKARNFLRRSYAKMGMQTSGLTFKRLFLYRPLLALFLTARISLDLWSSMFIEILWVVGCFCWGLIRLLHVLQLEHKKFASILESGPSDWSFGQVVPLVLLAAPLLTVFESFLKVQQPSNALSTALVQFHTGYSQFDHSDALLIPSLQERDHPDRDFYQDSGWARSMIYSIVIISIGIATTTLLTVGLGASEFLVVVFIPNSPIILRYLPIYLSLTVWMLIMLFILLEDISCAHRNVLGSIMGIKRKRVIQGCKTVIVCYSLLGIIMTNSPWLLPFFMKRAELNREIPAYLFCVSAVIYCMLSTMVFLVTHRHGKVF